MISDATRRALVGRRHLLTPDTGTDDLPALADAVLALHSTDPVSVYLSAWARMRRPDRAAVDASLYENRCLVRHHVMRRTLWVATPETLRLMHATTTAGYAAAQHRRVVGMLTESGVADPEAWLGNAKTELVAVLGEAMREEGPLPARVLGQRVPALAHPLRMAIGTKHEGTQSAHSRVLLQLGFEGALVRANPIGSWINGQYRWAVMDSWLPEDAPRIIGADPAPAAVELARRYLRAFGPVTTEDLKWWAGWTLGLTRKALAGAGAVAVELDGGTTGWLAPDDPDLDALTGSREFSTEPWIAVLPGLDPTTMGWKQRGFYLPEAALAKTDGVFDPYGNAGGSIWVDGAVAGGWVQASDGSLPVIWYTDLPAARRRQVLARLEELRDWLGEYRFKVRFPAPFQKHLISP